MEQEIEYIEALLKERGSEREGCKFGMNIEFHDDEYHVRFFYGLPNSDAGIFYHAKHKDLPVALCWAKEKVIEDKKINEELG